MKQLADVAQSQTMGTMQRTLVFKGKKKEMVKPHGRLVLVSSTYYYASTPSLLPCGLQGAFRVLRPGRPNLEVGFPLRCFQRLSIPDVATRRCGWCHNRNTRGQSNPVLSY